MGICQNISIMTHIRVYTLNFLQMDESRLVAYVYYIMVLLLDGNPEIGAIRSNLCYLICLGHLIRLKAVTNRTRKEICACMRAQHELSYHLL